MSSDVINFADAKKTQAIKRLENEMLNALVFDHADELFPGFKENFMNEYRDSDSATKVSYAIEGLESRIREIHPEMADKYREETMKALVSFYKQLSEDVSNDEVSDNIDDDDGDSESGDSPDKS